MVCPIADSGGGFRRGIAIGLLDATGVLVQPGRFYNFPSDGYLVISLITPGGEFAGGIERLLGFVVDLHS